MLTEGSMDASEHTDNTPAPHTDEGRADVTSFLLSTAEGTMGDEREIEERYDVEERTIALVVPFGVVRVKTPGIAHLSAGRLFKGDFPSSLVSSCACIRMTSSDGL
jgi:hypothetical protein